MRKGDVDSGATCLRSDATLLLAAVSPSLSGQMPDGVALGVSHLSPCVFRVLLWGGSAAVCL